MTPDPRIGPDRAATPGDDRRPGPVAGVLLLVPPALVLLAVGLLTPTAGLFPHQGDVSLYLERGGAFAGGAVPYRDFRLEYPPLALIAMVVPYLLSPGGPPDLDAYKWLFLAWEAALLVALGLVLRSIGARVAPPLGPASLALRLTLLTVAAALPLAWRYDLLPALLVMLAILAALEGQASSAGLGIGLGILAKVYPVVVLPAVAVQWLAARDRRALARVAAGAVVVPLAGLALFALAAGIGVFEFVGYQVGRGLQIESLGGGLVLLGGLLRGTPAELDFRFSAVHVAGGFADAWLAILPLLTVAGFGAMAWLTWVSARALRARAAGGEVSGAVGSLVVRLATAWILVLIVTSKVFSVQYVVWILPLAALLPRGQLWLMAAIGGLSMAIHPFNYPDLILQKAGPILLLNLRNVLVVGLLAWIVADIRRDLRAGQLDAARRDP